MITRKTITTAVKFKFTGTGRTQVVWGMIWGWKENEELLFHVYGVSVWEDEKFWSWIIVMVVEQCKCP